MSFIDAESGYTNDKKQKVSFESIVMEHLRDISRLSFEDADKYMLAINSLADLLSARFDEQMKEDEKRINKEKEEILKKFDELNMNNFSGINYDKIKKNQIIINKRNLLRALSAFLYRVKYFKAQHLEE